MLKIWWMAFRPKTLSAAIVPIVVATALIYAEGYEVHLWVSILALVSALFIQIGTNLINDAIDFKKGADTEERIGPQRVTQSGLISSNKVLLGGGLCFVISLICGIPLVIHGGWPIVLIGLTSLFLGYSYTGGPFPLAYLGLGDFFVILFFGIISVEGVYYLQSLSFSWLAFIAGIQVGFLATVLIAINNLRDVEQDKKVNKKTLAVRFGKNFVKLEIFFLIFLSYILLFFWFQEGYIYGALLPLTSLIMAIPLLKSIQTEAPGEIFNSFLAKASLLHMLFGFQLAFGFILQGLF